MAAAVAVLALGACGQGEPVSGVRGEMTVFAAGELEAAFTAVGAHLEDSYPGLDVVFTFGDGADLARQVAQGADVDVLAASAADLAGVGERAADTRVFARDRAGVDLAITTIAERHPHPGAPAFADAVRSPFGKQQLVAAGFETP